MLTLSAGDLLGLTSTYDGVASASAIAATETTLMFLPADAVLRLIAAYPAVGNELAVEASARARMVRRLFRAGGPSSGIRRRW